MSDNSSSRIICFSTFEVNLQTGELRQRGQKVKLQEQPFQLLVALLEQPGQVVSREELRSKLWPADTFVDFDHSLNAAIKRLRDALGESADAPVFIETLARRGYRFIAPVNYSSTSEVIGATPARKQGRSFFSGRGIAIACLAPIIIVTLVGAIWRKPLRRSDITGVYLKLIRTGETHAVPLAPNFSFHVDDWFPDGSHLLASRKDEAGKQSLWSISVFGGSPRPLVYDAAGGSVSPDGTHI